MKCLGHLVCGVALVFAMNAAAHAQARVDMKQFTCEQLLSGSSNAIEASIWLSGYYNGTRRNTVMDMGQLKQNAEVIVTECRANPKKTVMQTISSMLSAGKKR